MARQGKTIQEKVEAEFPEFVESIMGLSVEELNARITQYTKNLDESEEHRKANETLRNLKDQVAEINGPYNDVKKAINLKTKYIIELVKEKGGR